MKRNSLVVLGLSAVLGFGLFGVGCSDDSKTTTDSGAGGSDAKGIDSAVGTGGKGAGGATGTGGAVGSGGSLDGGGGSSTGGVTGAGGSSTGGATGAGGSSTAFDGGPDLKGIDVGNTDAVDAPINHDLPPVVVDGGVDAPDTSITPVDTGIDIGAVDGAGIDGASIDGAGLDGGID
jgi:hypothetical protein